MNDWIIVVAAGAGTYAIRLTFLVFVQHSRLPDALRAALAYVTPAVLAAIALPAVLYAGGDGAFQPANPRVFAALVAAAVARASANVWATIAAGMAALWTLETVL